MSGLLSVKDLPPLPRGPHALSREAVEQSQRERLLIGATEAFANKGYAATAVADIISAAGVSRATFYRLYSDKHDCFLQAAQLASNTVVSVIAGGLTELVESSDDATPLEKIDALLASYLQTISDYAPLARVFLVEVYAAGPEAVAQRRDALGNFALLVASIIGDPADPETKQLADVLVAAVSSIVTNAVGAGEGDSLPEMHAPLLAVASKILTAAGAA